MEVAGGVVSGGAAGPEEPEEPVDEDAGPSVVGSRLSEPLGAICPQPAPAKVNKKSRESRMAGRMAGTFTIRRSSLAPSAAPIRPCRWASY